MTKQCESVWELARTTDHIHARTVGRRGRGNAPHATSLRIHGREDAEADVFIFLIPVNKSTRSKGGRSKERLLCLFKTPVLICAKKVKFWHMLRCQTLKRRMPLVHTIIPRWRPTQTTRHESARPESARFYGLSRSFRTGLAVTGTMRWGRRFPIE